jgi:putative ABC transport system ATP-binding protein
VIELKGITKRYRDGDQRVEVVADVNMSLPDDGGLFALVGPSGAGKTTLLALMGGLVAPTSGSVSLRGEEITHLRDHHRTALRKRAVGFVFQELGLLDQMSTLENVLLPLIPEGGAHKKDVARARALLTRFKIGSVADRSVDRLSGGQRQRAAMARALILDPPILLLDEPTAHLDTDNARALVDHLVALAGEGRTVLAATHDVRVYGDPRVKRVLRLTDGRLRNHAEDDT